MIRALFTAATGVEAQQLTVDIIANNLANANTIGFKKSRGDFQDLLYETIRPAGSRSSAGIDIPVGIQIGQGARAVAVERIFSQGDYQNTQKPLDLAIEGQGFFQIVQPNGDVAYTRAGAFSLDSQGRIVTPDGYPMEPEITIPADAVNITVTSDGTVTVLQPGQLNPTEVGNIEIARFFNPGGLNSIGKNLFLPTDVSGAPEAGTPGEQGFGAISQGFLEMSNVSIAEELVNMIVAQRAYEINSKVIKTANEMLEYSNNIK